MKHILSLFIVIFPLLISAQESIVIGHKEKLYSETLNEERNYWIYLPPSYQDNNYGKASYPVIYLLDGDTHFTTAVAIQKTFTRGMYNNMPECIIVGILNTDRSRDLTPSKSSFKHNGKVLLKIAAVLISSALLYNKNFGIKLIPSTVLTDTTY